MLNIAIRAARAAGTIITRSVEQVDTLTITSKARNQFVSEVDERAEGEIIAVIHKAYPDHGILAEESGTQGNDEYQWIIDPLDGTTNFLYGVPHFAISIALRHRGRLEHGVVYDPIRNELFTASRGAGAQLNSRRIRVTTRRGLDEALLGTGMPYSDMVHLDAYLGMLKALIPPTAGIRRPGSASLDLAYVAAGRYDGFWEIGLNPWDIAAGVLLIQEAGGLVSDLAGNPRHMETGHIVAAGPKVFKAMLQTLKPHLTDALR